MIKVLSRHNENSERLLQRFKRLCVKEGLFREMRSRKYYEKPSVKRRRKEKEAQRALRKRMRREAASSRRARTARR